MVQFHREAKEKTTQYICHVTHAQYTLQHIYIYKYTLDQTGYNHLYFLFDWYKKMAASTIHR